MSNVLTVQLAVLNADSVEAEWMCQALAPLRHICRSWQSESTLLHQLNELDLLVLAWREPDKCIDIVREVRRQQASLPMLFIVQSGAEDNIIAAMRAGIDDYIIKPIRPAEFRTRVSVLLRHLHPERDALGSTRIGNHTFYHRHLLVRASNLEVSLTQKEFDLALLFFRHLERPLSRSFIREAIWPREAGVPSRTLDTHVSRVRSKLRLHPENGFRLLPVYSFGYRLEQLTNPGQQENCAMIN